MITALIVLIGIGIMGWGYWKSRPNGQLGLYTWLQSVMLLLPWVIFLGLFSAGMYLDLTGMLVLFVASTAGYVVLGNKIRTIAPEELARRTEALIKARAEVDAPKDLTDPTSISSETPLLPIDGNNIVPIPDEELQLIRGIFGLDTFFATETLPFQDGVVFNGNLRGELNSTFDKLTVKLAEKVGDRYRLFMIENNDLRPTVVVLPRSNDPKALTPPQQILAVVLFFVTIATCLETSGILQGFDFYVSLDRYREVLPIGLGIISILVAHELGHWLMARRYDVKLSLPFFLPTWEIGAFGALTNFQSILKSRNVLFDIAIAGPAAGGLLSFGLLLTGLILSNEASQFKVPTEFFQGSVLVGTMARVILGNAVQNETISVNPMVILGWLGLVINAINLMPAGRLDGGRIVQAIYGRKIANRATTATLIVLTLVSLVNPLALYWAIVILFLQRTLERPSLNEITEPDDTRAALALLSLFLMITVLLPLTPSVAGRLGFHI
jgi:membrane-associated protease RseP (regulator of RpoE activity)